MVQKNSIISIAGPTCVGKSQVSVYLAKRLDAIVISLDSVQIYKGLDIGSAKITEDEMNGVPHFMIDIADPNQDYDVIRFRDQARYYIDSAIKNNKNIVLAGGSGFYLRAVMMDNDFTDSATDEGLRKKLYDMANTKGVDKLFAILQEKDSLAASKIDKNNIKRVIRAIEYISLTGESIIIHNQRELSKGYKYSVDSYFLNDDRAVLYDRINKRVDAMVENGLIDEVKRLLTFCRPESLSLSSIGYKETVKYLNGEIPSLEELKSLIAKNTRHLAKRQITYFKHQLRGTIIDISQFNRDLMEVSNYIYNDVRKRKNGNL